MNNPLNNLLIILTLIVSYLASAQSPAEFFKTDIGAVIQDRHSMRG